MKERPILFQGAMVRALLPGTKTQTRRVCKGTALEWLQPENFTPEYVALPENGLCPYGFAGDQLWGRETWGYFDPDGGNQEFNEDGPASSFREELMQEGHALRDYWRRRIAYAATWKEPRYGNGPAAPKRWRPSIHMPRWASRILLDVTGVRVERLQSISEADAIAEGIEPNWLGDLAVGPNGFGSEGWVPNCGWKHYLHSVDDEPAYTAIESYRSLWESINGLGSWDANPWVWVVEFKLTAAEQVPTGINARNSQQESREERAARYVRESGKSVHASDCATSCAPAFEPGQCDCNEPQGTHGVIACPEAQGEQHGNALDSDRPTTAGNRGAGADLRHVAGNGQQPDSSGMAGDPLRGSGDVVVGNLATAAEQPGGAGVHQPLDAAAQPAADVAPCSSGGRHHIHDGKCCYCGHVPSGVKESQPQPQEEQRK